MPEPLVLLHGLGMSARAWRPVVDGLRHGGHDVHALTLPGHRGGPPPPRPLTIHTLTDAVESTCDALGAVRPHVVGNSLGGWIALELARRGRAGSVTALAPAGAWHDGVALLRLELALRGGALLGHPLARLYLGNPHTRRLLLAGLVHRGDRIPAREAGELLRDLRACTVLADVRELGRRDGGLLPLEATDCPVHIVWGRQDRTLPFRTYGRPLVDLVRGSAVTLLDGAGHVPMYDRPDEVLRIVLGQAAPLGGDPTTGRP